MNIEINNRNPRYTALGLHQSSGDCRIIEYAKSFATISMRVMRATRKIDGRSLGNRRAASCDGRSGRAP